MSTAIHRTGAEKLFLAAVDLTEDGRQALLESAPPQIRTEAEALLAADAEAARFFARPLGLAVDGDTPPPPEAEFPPGARIGPYGVGEKVGQGGMGEVYRAERADGLFKQTVALKVVRRSMASADILARAATERHALARLQHPGVARLLGAGETPDGRPYLAMEFIDGEPLLAYANSRGLSVEDRLGVFLQVCEAVAAAHRALVVHRDLKPSNVLVADTDDGPRVTLLDFGIAKVLDGSDGLTRTDIRPFTPAYAAPEQRSGDVITTSTDIWALGALLFELLTGQRAVDEASGARPSTAATRENAPLAASGAMVRQLRGDLDAITMKALREEPEARYPSADALAEDVRRYLTRRPVAARHGSARYLAGRFLRRHRIPVAGAAVVVILVATFVGLLITLQARTQAALNEAEAVASFLEQLFFENDRGSGHGEEYTVRQALDAGSRRAALLEGQPDVHSRMLDVMGRTYRALLDYDKADSLLQAAVDVRTEAFGPDDDRTLESLHHLGYLREAQGRDAEAERLYRAVLAARRQRLRSAPQDVVESEGEVAGLLVDLGRTEEARAHVQAGLSALQLAVRKGFDGDPRFHEGHLRQTLARAALADGHVDAAERSLREARALYGGGLGTDDHIYVAFIERTLAHVLLDLGRLSEADRILTHAEHILARDLPANHPAALATRQERGRLEAARGHFERATSLFESLLADAEQSQPVDAKLAASASMGLAGVLYDRGSLQAARVPLDHALAYARTLPPASDLRRHIEALAQRRPGLRPTP